MTLIPERVARLDSIILDRGSHKTYADASALDLLDRMIDPSAAVAAVSQGITGTPLGVGGGVCICGVRGISLGTANAKGESVGVDKAALMRVLSSALAVVGTPPRFLGGI